MTSVREDAKDNKSYMNLALERHNSFKHLRLVGPKLDPHTGEDEFIPLSDVGAFLGVVWKRIRL